MPGRKEDATAVPNAIAHWRNAFKPVTPDKSVIQLILDVLYGDRFPQHRQAMLELWEMARGRVLDGGPDELSPDTLLDWDDRSSIPVLRGVDLRLHRPRGHNEPDTMRIEGSLWIEPAEYEHPAGPVVIGIREPFLSVESERYQTAKQSLVSERGNKNFERANRAAKIVLPKDHRGRIKGDPLGEDYIAIVEPCADGEEQVTVMLTTSQRGFDVTKLGNTKREIDHPNRDAVLNALIVAKLDKHPATDRAIVARAQMRRKPKSDA
jgi:hypothetical protein